MDNDSQNNTARGTLLSIAGAIERQIGGESKTGGINLEERVAGLEAGLEALRKGGGNDSGYFDRYLDARFKSIENKTERTEKAVDRLGSKVDELGSKMETVLITMAKLPTKEEINIKLLTIGGLCIGAVGVIAAILAYVGALPRP